MPTPRVLITCTLMMGACTMDPASDGVGAPENAQVSARRVAGSVDRSSSALHASGTLSAATTAEVVTYDEDGTRSVHGVAAVSADGSFAIDASGMTRTFLVEVSNEAGAVIGATVATTSAEADDASTTEVGTITTETSAEAAVWVAVVVEGGWNAATSREVVARVDGALAASIDAWLDAHDDESAVIEAMGSAVIAAQVAREETLSEQGEAWTASLAAVVRAAVATSEDGASFAAGLDSALESEGYAAEARLAVTARAEATFRAVAEAHLDAYADATTASTVDLVVGGSAGLEAWLYGEAWEQLDTSTDAELIASVAADLRALASSCSPDAPDEGEAASDCAFDESALLDGSLAAALGLDGASLLSEDGLSIDLAALLGLSASADADETAEAFDEAMLALRAELTAQVEAAASAGDDEAVVSAVIAAYAELDADLASLTEDAEASAAVRAALSLSAGAFVVAD